MNANRNKAAVNPNLVSVRCKACHKIVAEVDPKTVGTIRIKCKGAKCTNWITLTLPAVESGSGYTGDSRLMRREEKAVAGTHGFG